MLKVKQFYLEEWNWFKARFLKIFIIVTVIFLLAAFLSHAYFVNHPDQAKKKAIDLFKKLQKKIPPQATGFNKFLFLSLNNSTALFIPILSGLIPFLFLPLLGVFANGVSLGVVTSISSLKGFKVMHILLFSIVPHGIFEIPALIYATSLGVWLTLQISKKILHTVSMEPVYLFSKNNLDHRYERLFPLFMRIFRTWIGVILPLLLVAAMIETFVTPVLVNIFLER